MTSFAAEPPTPVPVLEIGGTHVSAGWVDHDAAGRFRTTQVSRRPLDNTGTTSEIAQQIAETAGRLDAGPGQHWGVAMPGPFDVRSGVGHYTEVGKFGALTGVNVRALLADAVRSDESRIAMLDDAEAFLLGEWQLLGGPRHLRCVGLTLGTGIGSAFVADGKLCRQGANVPPGGRIHLTSVDGVPVEELAARRAIIRAYREVTDEAGSDLDVADICHRARADDDVAAAVLSAAWCSLGFAIAPWLSRFGADLLIVGGSICRSWDLLEPPLAHGLAQSGVYIKMRRAAAPDVAPLIGAARHALCSMTEDRHPPSPLASAAF